MYLRNNWIPTYSSWSPDKLYNAGDRVETGLTSLTFICNNDNTTGTTFNIAQWTPILPHSLTWKGTELNFNSSTFPAVSVGDVYYLEDTLYIALQGVGFNLAMTTSRYIWRRVNIFYGEETYVGVEGNASGMSGIIPPINSSDAIFTSSGWVKGSAGAVSVCNGVMKAGYSVFDISKGGTSIKYFAKAGGMLDSSGQISTGAPFIAQINVFTNSDIYYVKHNNVNYATMSRHGGTYYIQASAANKGIVLTSGATLSKDTYYSIIYFGA